MIGPFAWLKTLLTHVCNVVRFERTRNDDNRTLYEVLRVACMLVYVVYTVLEIIIKLRRLKSARAGACIIQILQELKLEPALLKIKRTGRVSN